MSVNPGGRPSSLGWPSLPPVHAGGGFGWLITGVVLWKHACRVLRADYPVSSPLPWLVTRQRVKAGDAGSSPVTCTVQHGSRGRGTVPRSRVFFKDVQLNARDGTFHLIDARTPLSIFD